MIGALALGGLSLAAAAWPASAPVNGKIVFQSSREGSSDVFVMNQDGTSQQAIGYREFMSLEQDPAWSPDGTRIAFASSYSGLLPSGVNRGIFVMHSDGSSLQNLATPSSNDFAPRWSPDGSKLVFFSQALSGFTNAVIATMNADGTGRQVVSASAGGNIQPDWSPDGTRIAFISTRDHSLGEVYVMAADGSGVTRLTFDDAIALRPRWSPDGQQIAWETPDSIMVMNADGSGRRTLVANAASVAWSPDGRSIAFMRAVAGDAEIWRQELDGTGETRLTFSPGPDTSPDWQRADGTGPEISVPSSLTVEATGAGGAVVEFVATASDPVDGSIAVSCVPPSGTLFPLGRTTVTCSAENSRGTSSAASFDVDVVDTTPPRISGLTDLEVETGTSEGAVVAYTLPTATDLVNGAVPVTCTPPPGSLFPLGDTAVSCSASDSAGNSASGSFLVHVRALWYPLEVLRDEVTRASLDGPWRELLSAPLRNAIGAFSASPPDQRAGCRWVRTFVVTTKVAAARRVVRREQAESWAARARTAAANLGCR